MNKLFLLAAITLLGWGAMAQSSPITWTRPLGLAPGTHYSIGVNGYGALVVVRPDTADYLEAVWCNAEDTACLYDAAKQSGLIGNLTPLGPGSAYLHIQAFSRIGTIVVHTTMKNLHLQCDGMCRVMLLGNEGGVDLNRLHIIAQDHAFVDIETGIRCAEGIVLIAEGNAIIEYGSLEASRITEKSYENALIHGFRKNGRVTRWFKRSIKR